MKHVVDMHVGKKLKQIRRTRRMSQTDVAEQLNVSFQQVMKYERGTNRIAASRLFELALILNVPVSYFFEDLENSARPEEQSGTEARVLETLSSIKNDQLKQRIMLFVSDIVSASESRAA